MTPEHYQRIKAICDQVLNTPPAGREGILSQCCSGDMALESEVRRLLGGLEGGAVADPSHLIFESGELLANRFRAERFLGCGGMGQVWEAFDEELGESVAIKTIRGEIVRDSHAVERLKRELRNARRVSHPNVCRVYDFFIHTTFHGPIPFLTMQLLRGETLADRLRRQRPLPEPVAGRILEQCADGLRAAHAAGLVHGDFKPGNVMLLPAERGELRAVITDFGLARYAPAGATGSTISLPNAGTPGYMAPEHLAGRALGPAADVYAFAVVACELLTGLRPGEGGLDHLPARWQAPIRKALNPDPRQRGAHLPCRSPTKLRQVLWLAVSALLLASLLVLFLWQRHTPPPPQTVAILPFVQESGQKEDVFFAEGLTDEIISSLSRIPALRVVARNSSSHVDTSLSASDIADQLHARYLITGSVRPLGDRLQITAELTDVIANVVLWMQTYARDRSQVTMLHAEIVQGLTSRLGMQYSLAQVGAFGSRVPRQDAAAVYERGRSLWSLRDPQDLRLALQCFTDAIAIDPQFALAHAARADTLAIMAEGSYLPAITAFPQAKEGAIQAIILDPNLPEAHAALGLIESIGEWDLYNAQKSLQRAIQLAPSYIYAHQWYGAVLLKLGKYDEAIREAELAVRLDPLSPATLASLGWMNFYSRRFPEAIRVADQLARDHPQFPYTCLLRGNSLTSQGAMAEALHALALCSADVRQTPVYLRALAVAQAFSGNEGAAMDTLNQMLSMRARRPVADSYLAAVYASLKMPDEAFYWLDQGIIHHDPLTALVDVIPFFDPIRSDPRFAQALARVGLPHKK